MLKHGFGINTFKLVRKNKKKFSMYSPLTIFFQLLKLLIAAQQKVSMLKHRHIQNQHTQINWKKQKKFQISK